MLNLIFLLKIFKINNKKNILNFAKFLNIFFLLQLKINYCYLWHKFYH
jgi:hypothetical protein